MHYGAHHFGHNNNQILKEHFRTSSRSDLIIARHVLFRIPRFRAKQPK